MKPLTSSEFLRLVWPSKLLSHETLELRTIRRQDGTIRREFAHSVEDFLKRAEKYKDREVYFGVGTRFGEDGTKTGVYRVRTWWCDLDGKKLEDCNFNPRPDILVRSGGGVHAYWLLDSPLLVRGQSQRFENITASFARLFKADLNTTDVSRILRVPGFLNHKYDPVREVRAYAL